MRDFVYVSRVNPYLTVFWINLFTHERKCRRDAVLFDSVNYVKAYYVFNGYLYDNLYADYLLGLYCGGIPRDED